MPAHSVPDEPSLARLLAIVALAVVAAAVCAAELVRAGDLHPGAGCEAADGDEDAPRCLDPRTLSGRPASAPRAS